MSGGNQSLYGSILLEDKSAAHLKAITYDDFLDRLLSTYCTEGLIALSVR